MKLPTLCLRGGRVIDPTHGVDGIQDIWICGDRIVEAPVDPNYRAPRTIHLRGDVVMAGGVDMHTHVAGPKVNLGRRMTPPTLARDDLNEHPRGQGRVPTILQTGRLYAAMGYTTVVDAAIAPTKAALAHLELTQLPVLDSAILALAGNEAPILEAVRDSSAELVRSRLASTLAATHAWGIKVVDPGGIARWKAGHPHPTELDDPVDGCPGLTPRRLVHSLADAVTSLGLPHAVHLHGFKLGLPGSAETLLDLFQSLEGRRVHFAHIQFHSYGGGSGSLEGFASRVAELADLVNRHDQITLDVGQVMFGPTMVMTADSGVGEYLADLTGRPWNSVDIACESGCAVLPVNYMPRNVAHALQWSIGLEWYLRVADPWRMALTTDHPNGGFFQVYPELIALLMSRELRREAVSLLPESVQKSTSLSELDREYSLAEIAILTRAAPARILGMSDRGHLGPGAIADIVVYRDNSERARMFGIPVRVWKSGLEIHGEGERDVPLAGETLAVRCAAASAETDSHMYRDVRYEDSDRSRCLRRLREVEAVPR